MMKSMKLSLALADLHFPRNRTEASASMKIALAKKLKEEKDTLTVYDEIVEEQGCVVKKSILIELIDISFLLRK